MICAVSSIDSVVWVTNESASGLLHLQCRNLIDILDQINIAAVAAIVLAHRAFDFGMALVADQNAFAAGAAVAQHFHMHLGHQRAGGIETPLSLRRFGLVAHRLGEHRAH